MLRLVDGTPSVALMMNPQFAEIRASFLTGSGVATVTCGIVETGFSQPCGTGELAWASVYRGVANKMGVVSTNVFNSPHAHLDPENHCDDIQLGK